MPMSKKEMRKRYRLKHKDEIKKKNKEYRLKNKDEIKKKRKESYEKTRKYIPSMVQLIKLHYGCRNPTCEWGGDFLACCLEFHHLGDKNFMISEKCCGRTKDINNLLNIINEINKCIVLCINCHRQETAGIINVSALDACRVSIPPDICFNKIIANPLDFIIFEN